MKTPYITALNVPFRLLAFVKKLTVSGIIGKTHGVIKAINPPNKPKTKIFHKVLSVELISPQLAEGFLSSTSGSLYFLVLIISSFVITDSSCLPNEIFSL